MEFKLNVRLVFLVVSLLLALLPVDKGKAENLNYACPMNPMTLSDTISPDISMISFTVLADSSLSGKAEIKNPYKTFVVALMGGSAMHGLGHWYIGRKQTFWILFGIEMVPILYILLPLETTLGIGAEVDDPFFMTCFFSTWLYDLIVSPIQCHRMNEKDRKSSLRPYLGKTRFGDINVGLQLTIPL